MSNKEVIQIAWAPNVEWDDIFLAISLIFTPWRWFSKKAVGLLTKKFSEFLGVPVAPFDSGRSALYKIFQQLGISRGDEVLLQAFTCVALPNPILWVGAKPVWVDVDVENYNIDLDDLERKITEKTKAVIVQYTFGISPDISKLRAICEKHNILLIEDCCHNLGQKIIVDGEEKMAGTIGDASMFSMGMEKVVSATRGGFGWIRDAKLNTQLQEESDKLQKPRLRDIFRGIFNPIVWKLREKLGKFGTLIYKLAIKLKIHELGLTELELVGQKASWLPYSMPNSNAILGLNQFRKIRRFIEYRKVVAQKYIENLGQPPFHSSKGGRPDDIQEIIDKSGYYFPSHKELSKYADPGYLRFPLLVDNANELRAKAEQKNIYLGNWYTEVIHCKDVNMSCMLYDKGSCPNAEWLVGKVVNLPTHVGIGGEEVERVTEVFDLDPSM